MTEPPEEWPGRYRWIEIDGETLSTGHCWSMIPDRIARIIAFIPEEIPEPHTQADHEILESFRVKFAEIRKRTQ